MANKKDLYSYITRAGSVKTGSTQQNRNGEATKPDTNREYVVNYDATTSAANQVKGLAERLEKSSAHIDHKSVKHRTSSDDIGRIEKEVEDEEIIDEEMLDESALVAAHIANNSDNETSPMSYVPNSHMPETTTKEMNETAKLIELVSTLIDKIDDMQNFNPVIHVPAPVIHVTLPETKRTVTKAIERDENNLIKTVHESIEESPSGDPLVEVNDDDTPKRRKRST
jgi:hypothetical protein